MELFLLAFVAVANDYNDECQSLLELVPGFLRRGLASCSEPGELLLELFPCQILARLLKDYISSS